MQAARAKSFWKGLLEKVEKSLNRKNLELLERLEAVQQLSSRKGDDNQAPSQDQENIQTVNEIVLEEQNHHQEVYKSLQTTPQKPAQVTDTVLETMSESTRKRSVSLYKADIMKEIDARAQTESVCETF